MKQTLLSFICLLVVVSLSGCKRERYEMGNVSAPSTEAAPSYSETADTQPAVKTN
jgi:hypothetical protein